MPVSRDADGNIIDIPTEKVGHSTHDRPTEKLRSDRKPSPGPIDKKTDGRSAYDIPTHVSPDRKPRPGPAGGKTGYDAPTKVVTRDTRGEDPPTEIYSPGFSTKSPVATDNMDYPPHRIHNETEITKSDDPPVGWLVVVDGPGRGASLTLGNGVNSIGRDANQRLPLDFGDELISRAGHATITYDPRGKKFYIQHGGGTNLTYVNDQPVLAPQELTASTHILMGNTTLRFVPLCGEEFDWDMAGQGPYDRPTGR